MKIKGLGLALAVWGCLGLSASGAEAQARSGVAASGAQALAQPVAPPSLLQEDDGLEEVDPDPMGVVSIGVRVGLSNIAASDMTTSNVSTKVANRRGLHLAVPLSFGGSGFNWTLEPFLSKSTVTTSTEASLNSNGVTGGFAAAAEGVDVTAYGVYTGPGGQIQLIRPLYLGIGLGLRAAYVSGPAFEVAADGGVRMPVSLTYYPHEHIGLVAEFGLGYGVSLFKTDGVASADVAGLVQEEQEIEDGWSFGHALAWDCSFGVRLP